MDDMKQAVLNTDSASQRGHLVSNTLMPTSTIAPIKRASLLRQAHIAAALPALRAGKYSPAWSLRLEWDLVAFSGVEREFGRGGEGERSGRAVAS